jgi:hypothetical protein
MMMVGELAPAMMLVGDRLMTNHESVAKMPLRELVAYRAVLERWLDITSSPIIAMTLKQVYSEIEWRNASPSAG